VQREVHPLDLHVVLGPELLNTHGTEIAPGSDVVGEHLHGDNTRRLLILHRFNPPLPVARSSPCLDRSSLVWHTRGTRRRISSARRLPAVHVERMGTRE
jgi:hypothetical protein